jgi:hypothetical protein
MSPFLIYGNEISGLATARRNDLGITMKYIGLIFTEHPPWYSYTGTVKSLEICVTECAVCTF